MQHVLEKLTRSVERIAISECKVSKILVHRSDTSFDFLGACAAHPPALRIRSWDSFSRRASRCAKSDKSSNAGA
jgi:hypothetical protein